ncbi:quinolinate synthase NadA [Lujinxingia vulgaris]|uniref:Quinolinate synthase n=1 Tax=Lujinxingia vulgaris TaxID=2600176 RepID=A0A5C6XA95_9DELT|nr:quinolinate synthase NadA [Lujinxingia vulgaris]TXD35683.1 quinolinate synthase NadA [Lujinxingia vulgaris]
MLSQVGKHELYERVRKVVTEPEMTLAWPLIAEIRELKRAREAVILAHNYQHPLIFHGVADLRGDSLQLARLAQEVEARTLVMCGVHFMAETAKLLSPKRSVLLPSFEAGCSLADAITPEDVRALRRQYPGVPVVSYVNTTAAVKAVSDVCCTSSNALKIVEALGSPRVIFVPDRHLAGHVARQTEVEIITWEGGCVVHEEFRLADIEALRASYPQIKVIAHPECHAEVQEAADMVGSTSALIDWVAQEKPREVAMITECTMSDNVASHFPEVAFHQPCSICPYMRKITLEGIRDVLRDGSGQVEIAPTIAAGARRAVARMLELS